jgi:uncharacterized surface protein with fasciclin (FAS1) repeats
VRRGIQPPVVDTQIVRDREEWNDDRTGRFVLVGLVFAVAFLIVAIALWWASGANRGRTEALASDASAVAPVNAPATVAGSADPAGAASTLPLSSYPLPAQAIVMRAPPHTDPPAPVASQPAAAPVAIAETTTTTTTAPTTTTTTTPTTTTTSTTMPPATTVKPPPTTVAATLAPGATTPATSTSTSTSTTTTIAPTTTVPGPVVTSPASPDATLLDVVTNTPDLSRVRELVEISGFAGELDAARPLTFLAPSNAAVDAWAATPQGQAVLADPDAVYDLLLRHLVPEALDEETVFTRTSLDTVSGAQLVVRPQSHTVGGADLLVVDVTAANGYLHVVSDVLT